MIRAIAFLGNIGAEYAKTRHNAAWLFADTIEPVRNAQWQHKFKGQFAAVSASAIATEAAAPVIASEAKQSGDTRDCFKGSAGGQNRNDVTSLYLIKPETYMNLSGESVGAMASFYRIKPEEILVVHDEIELPLDTISLKWSGGLGGHNGLRSMKSSLGTADFWRLRFGVGKPVHGDVAGYVLSPFTEDERITLSQVFDAGRECLGDVLAAKDPQHLIAKWGKVKCGQ